MLSKVFNSRALHWGMVISIGFAAAAATGGVAAAASAAATTGVPMASIPDAAMMGVEMFTSMYSGMLDVPDALTAFSNARDAGELWSFNHEMGSGLHSMSDMVSHGAVDPHLGHEVIVPEAADVPDVAKEILEIG